MKTGAQSISTDPVRDPGWNTYRRPGWVENTFFGSLPDSLSMIPIVTTAFLSCKISQAPVTRPITSQTSSAPLKLQRFQCRTDR